MPDALLSDVILNLLFPLSCVLCKTRVSQRRWGPVCPQCWSRMELLKPPFCPQCGMPEDAPSDNIPGLCSSCRLSEHAFDLARSALIFNDPLREVIHHFKYSERVSLAQPLGQLLCDCLANEPFQGRVIVPVPLHRSRERRRGFNQAELIAEALKRGDSPNRKIDTEILRRRKNTPSQTGLSRSQRAMNLAGAFEVRGPVPKCVIVVDDVYTTGATLHEIAITLKRAGAERVEVLTVARVTLSALARPE